MKVSFEYLKKRYGDPVLRFYPHGEFTFKEKIEEPIPFECAVFFIDWKSYKYVTCYRFRENDEWEWGCDRFAIRELFRLIKEERNKS